VKCVTFLHRFSALGNLRNIHRGAVSLTGPFNHSLHCSKLHAVNLFETAAVENTVVTFKVTFLKTVQTKKLSTVNAQYKNVHCIP
jgi:hypothetical protein